MAGYKGAGSTQEYTCVLLHDTALSTKNGMGFKDRSRIRHHFLSCDSEFFKKCHNRDANFQHTLLLRGQTWQHLVSYEGTSLKDTSQCCQEIPGTGLEDEKDNLRKI